MLTISFTIIEDTVEPSGLKLSFSSFRLLSVSYNFIRSFISVLSFSSIIWQRASTSAKFTS